MNEDNIDIDLIEEEQEIEIDLEGEVSEIYVYDYEKITNKPKINGIELVGNKSLQDLGLRPLSNTEIENLFKISKEGK